MLMELQTTSSPILLEMTRLKVSYPRLSHVTAKELLKTLVPLKWLCLNLLKDVKLIMKLLESNTFQKSTSDFNLIPPERECQQLLRTLLTMKLDTARDSMLKVLLKSLLKHAPTISTSKETSKFWMML